MKIVNPIAVELGIFLKKIWETNKDVLKETLVTGFVHRSICMSIYGMVTRDKSVTEFEFLEFDQKIKIWDEAKRVANGRLDKMTCVELAKSFYILDLLIEQ